MTGRTDGLIAPSDERWVTKRELADHLHVTPRWIELQQRVGLPCMTMCGLKRYRKSQVEAWLHERYNSGAGDD